MGIWGRWLTLGVFVRRGRHHLGQYRRPEGLRQPHSGAVRSVLGIPMNILVDANGVIVERDVRGERLLTKLSELLDG